MIDFIFGILVRKSANEAVVDVQGIGFALSISGETFETLPAEGEAIKLFTRLVHREDSMELFGFSTEFERTVFDKLITVKNIGPKKAVKILSNIEAQKLAGAIKSRDLRLLSKIPGIGKQTAEKVCLDLEKSFSRISCEEYPVEKDETNDAIDALEALGFPRATAVEAVREAVSILGDVSASDIIRAAMSKLNEKK